MASKYICSKCERKFIDWGAEKLGYKCPDCDDSELTEISFEPAAKAKKKPTLKRSVPKKVTADDFDSDETGGDDDDLLDAGDVDTGDDDDVGELDGFSITDGSDDDTN